MIRVRQRKTSEKTGKYTQDGYRQTPTESSREQDFLLSAMGLHFHFTRPFSGLEHLSLSELRGLHAPTCQSRLPASSQNCFQVVRDLELPRVPDQGAGLPDVPRGVSGLPGPQVWVWSAQRESFVCIVNLFLYKSDSMSDVPCFCGTQEKFTLLCYHGAWGYVTLLHQSCWTSSPPGPFLFGFSPVYNE